MIKCRELSILGGCFVLLMTPTFIAGGDDKYKDLNDRTYEVYQHADVRESFVCNDPNAGIFGGFGNLMITALATQLVGLLSNRVTVMNHHLMLSMFDHPDSRQSWSLIPSEGFFALKGTVKTRPKRCSDVKNIPFSKLAPKYGTNGCFEAYISHPESPAMLTSLLPLQYPESNISLYHQFSAAVGEWTFSRPAANWSSIMSAYRKKTFAPCGANIEFADMAVQFRTWRDVRGDKDTFHDVGGACHAKCAAHVALHTRNRLNRTICVFVTSDNVTSSAHLVNHLNLASNGSIKAVYAEEETGAAHWHSQTVVDSARWKTLDSSELQHHQSLKDWMLIGEASTAMYTAGSTFAVTARLRAGLQNQLHDVISEINGNKCNCESMFPKYNLEHQMHVREKTRRSLIEKRRRRERKKL